MHHHPTPEVTARTGGMLRIDIHETDAQALVELLYAGLKPGLTVLGKHRAGGPTDEATQAAAESLAKLRVDLVHERQLSRAMANTVAAPVVGKAR